MKIILGLYAILLLVGLNAFAQYEQEDEENYRSWGDKKIDFAFYKTLLSQKNCLTSVRLYLGCTHSLRVLVESMDPSLQIETRELRPGANAKIEFAAGLLNVVRDYKQQKNEPITSLKEFFERRQNLKDNFSQRFTEAYNQEQTSDRSAIEEIISYLEKSFPAATLQARVLDAINEYYHVGVDPHSDYRSKSEMFSSMFGSSKFVGLGIAQEPVPNGAILLRVVKNSGAERAGLLAGDVLLTADGKSLAGMKKSEISATIRGAENTKIQFKVLRKNHVFSVQVTRLKVETEPVESAILPMYNEKIGYIRLESFMYQYACKEISDILQNFNREIVKGAVLDLRGNGGGYLHITNCLAGLFLGTNKVIGYFEEADHEGKIQVKATLTDSEQVFTKPLAVLIDSDSASGSELLSGALKDHNRALIVGLTSMGKGSMQAAAEVLEDYVLYSTQGLFFLPSGQTNQTTGIKPHLTVYRHLHPGEDELYPLTERNMHFFPLQPRSIPVQRVETFDTLRAPTECVQVKNPQAIYKTAPAKSRLKDLQLATAAAAVSCF